ncbi:hypothetical protein [Acetobacter papayae]|uniref:hypothetical protein n=1 Tax=Acetobacter papayae TaxID=1076592 RepID=UPI0011DCFFCD|nr:hypothetical protein [Acetobacter papayae]
MLAGVCYENYHVSFFSDIAALLILPVRGVLAGTALFATGSWAVAATRGHGAGAVKAPPWSVAACMKMVGEDPSGALDYAQDAVHAGAAGRPGTAVR